MENQGDNITKIYNALGNPVRRQIVDILRTRGRAGFKELHESLKTSVGALYHHLETLEGIVAQGPDKKYLLTDEGRVAIDALRVSEEKIVTGIKQSLPTETKLTFLTKELFFGRSIFHYFNEESVRSLPIALFIITIGGWVSFQTNLEPLLLFYVSPSSGISRTWFMFLFPLGWLATFILTDSLSIGVFKRKGGELSLLNGTAFSMLPLLVVPGMISIAQLLSAPLRIDNYLLALLPIILQVWVVCLLSGAISISKGLKMEKAGLLSLGVIYANILLLLVGLQLGAF